MEENYKEILKHYIGEKIKILSRAIESMMGENENLIEENKGYESRIENLIKDRRLNPRTKQNIQYRGIPPHRL